MGLKGFIGRVHFTAALVTTLISSAQMPIHVILKIIFPISMIGALEACKFFNWAFSYYLLARGGGAGGC